MSKADSQYVLDDGLCNIIKTHRVKMNMTQVEVANLLGISRRTYARIESANTKKISMSTLKSLSQLLNFEIPNRDNNYSIRCTFSLPPETKNGLGLLKLKNNFDSISETILYCVNKVIKDTYMESVSSEIKKDVREALNYTYNQELEKLQKENTMNEMILLYLSQNSDIDLDKIKSDINEMMNKINHANKF